MGGILSKEVDEVKACEFYAEDYTKRFWRYSFLISTLYSANVKKEELFFKSHCLTSRDLNGQTFQDLKNSFSQIIGGLEDIQEMTAFKLQSLVGQRLRKNFPEYAKMVPNLDDYEAINGLEVAFSPRLSLKKVALNQ